MCSNWGEERGCPLGRDFHADAPHNGHRLRHLQGEDLADRLRHGRLPGWPNDQVHFQVTHQGGQLWESLWCLFSWVHGWGLCLDVFCDLFSRNIPTFWLLLRKNLSIFHQMDDSRTIGIYTTVSWSKPKYFSWKRKFDSLKKMYPICLENVKKWIHLKLACFFPNKSVLINFECFSDCVRTYWKVNGRLPERIVMFRTGVSHGELEFLKMSEIEPMKEEYKVISMSLKHTVLFSDLLFS